MQPNNIISIVCTDDNRREQAKRFSAQHNIPFDTNSHTALQLQFNENIIELFDTALNTSICVDFITGSLAHRNKYGGGKGQAIAKAIGLHKYDKPVVIDVTAGLARDAYVLASLGCQLTLIEQSPVLYTLIEDGLTRALNSNAEHAVTNFIELINANSQDYLTQIDTNSRPDIIYMDPMYPERKKSALVKKDMQILHKLIGHTDDEVKLLECALKTAKRRVVVKRPIHANPVAHTTPSTTISSKKTRYDVYVIS